MCITVSFDSVDMKNGKILAFDALKLRKIIIIFILGSLSNTNLYMVSIFMFDFFPSIWSVLGSLFVCLFFPKPSAKFDGFQFRLGDLNRSCSVLLR